MHRLALMATLAALVLPASAGAAAGEFDPSFGTSGVVSTQLGPEPDPHSTAMAIAYQPDGKIVVAGTANDPAGQEQFLVTRLMAAGDLDASFGSGGKVLLQMSADANPYSVLYALMLQPDGKIVLAGEATDATGTLAAIARLNADGSPDLSFGSNGKTLVQFGTDTTPRTRAAALALAPDGGIVFAGHANNTASDYEFVVARLRGSDGLLDTGFASGGRFKHGYGLGPDPFSRGRAVQVMPDGRIVAGGFARDAADRNTVVLARLDGAGNLDGSFGTGGAVVKQLGAGSAPRSSLAALRLMSDGRIVIGGDATGADGTPEMAGARFATNGELDASFGSGGLTSRQFGVGATPYTFTEALMLEPDGQVVLAGEARDTTGEGAVALLKLNSDGTVDSSFGSSGAIVRQMGFGGTPYSGATGIARQADGKLLVSSVQGDSALSGGSKVLAFRLFGGTPPTASFSVLTAPAFPGTPIAFDGSASSDADGSITSHAWDFGDGSSGSGATPTHAYASPGTYTVTLNVTDSDLLTASTSASVTVSAPPILRPILSKLKIAPSAVIAANKGATFTRRKTGATVSFVDSLAGVTTLTVQKPKRGVRKGKSCIAPPRKPAKRKAKRCTRWVKVGSAASHKDVAGLNRLHFTGRVNRKKLAPGRYRLRAVARLGGQAGPPVTKSFRIVRK